MAFPVSPSDYQLYKNYFYDPINQAWRRLKGDKKIGEIFPVNGAVLSASQDFPAICLSNIVNYLDIAITEFPLLVNEKRQDKIQLLYNDSGSMVTVEDFVATIVGTTVTLTGPNATDVDSILLALVEEAKFAANSETPNYTLLNRAITIADVEYLITGINLATDAITVDSSPGDGVGVSVSFYEHRVPGSSTSARLYSARGVSVMSPGDADRYFVGGLARRGYFQEFSGTANFHGGGDATVFANGTGAVIPYGFRTQYRAAGTTLAGASSYDGFEINPNGSAGVRTATTTNGPTLVTNLYMWAGVKL